MMSKKEISHTGRISSIEPDKISVEIVSESACSACQVAGLCSAPESKKKIIDVPNDGVTPHYVGEEVELCLGQSLGLKAVLISYVIPVVFLLILIVTLSALGKSELLAGLASVGGVAIYYFIVYLFRERLERKYEFYIKNVN